MKGHFQKRGQGYVKPTRNGISINITSTLGLGDSLLSLPKNFRLKQPTGFTDKYRRCLFFKSNFSESPGIYHIVANTI